MDWDIDIVPLPDKVRSKEMIPVEALRQAFAYVPTDLQAPVVDDIRILQNVAGDLYWRTPQRLKMASNQFLPFKPLAERSLYRGKWKVCHISGIMLYLHHVVWAYHTGAWPPSGDDHTQRVIIKFRNKIQSDTRIENLYRTDMPDFVPVQLPNHATHGGGSNEVSFRREDRD